MQPSGGMRRQPRSEAIKELGDLMRFVREAAGKSTYEVLNSARGGFYGSGSISNVENGHQKPGKGMLEDYATQFGFRDRLRAAYNRVVDADRAQHLKRLGRIPVDAPPPALDSPLEDIYASYRLEDDHKTFTIDGRGVLTDLNIVQKVRPVREGARLLSASYSYEVDRRRGVLGVQISTGGKIARHTEDDHGSVNLLIELDRAMNLSDPEPALISYKVTATTEVPTKPLLLGLALSPMARSAIGVQFTSPIVPQQIWWIRTRMITGPEQQPLPDRICMYSPTGFYFREFLDLTVGEFFGLAWTLD